MKMAIRWKKWGSVMLSVMGVAVMVQMAFAYRAISAGSAQAEIGMPNEDLLVRRSLETVDEAMLNGNVGAAMEALRWLEERVPTNVEVLYYLGLTTALSDVDAALPYFEKALTLETTGSEQNETVGDIRDVLRSLEAVAAIEDDIYAKMVLGQALGAQGEWRWAAVAFGQVVAEEVEYAEGWAFLGKAQEMLGQDGLPALQRAVRLDRRSVSGLVFLGDYYVRHDEVARGLVLYQLAVQEAPEDEALYVGLANGYLQKGDLQAAMEAFEEALGVAPDSIAVMHAFLDVLLHYEVYLSDKAVPLIERLDALGDASMTTSLYRGRVLLALGEYEQAAAYLESVVNYQPETVGAHYYLGLCLLQLEDEAGAVRAFENGLELEQNGRYEEQMETLLESLQ